MMAQSTITKDVQQAMKTPETCSADFCLVPIGTSSPSVAQEIAEVHRLVQASGLKFTMHSAGTTVDGSWDEVMRLIGQAHALLHQQGVVRVQTDIRVGTRTDKKQSFEDKITSVKNILAGEKK